MTKRELIAKFGGGDRRGALNHAVRAEIPGGTSLYQARAALQSEADRPRQGRHPAQVRAIRETVVSLDHVLDGLRKSIEETYGVERAAPDAQKETRPMAAASRSGAISEGGANKTGASVSIHAPVGATGESSPPPAPVSSEIDLRALWVPPEARREWTPPMAVVEMMAYLSDDKLGEITGMHSSTIARERKRLGIAPVEGDKEGHVWTPGMDRLLGTAPDDDLGKKWGRPGEAVRRRREALVVAAYRPKPPPWTEADLAVLRAEPDNARAAARLPGRSVASIKTMRSRMAKKNLVQ